MNHKLSRRQFLSRVGAGLSAAGLATNYALSDTAQQAVQEGIRSASEIAQEKVKIAVIGGTHIRGQNIAEGITERIFTVQTPRGASPKFYLLRHKGVPFYYLPFHGVSESVPVTAPEAMARAWAALHQLGVENVFGGATAGGINDKFDVTDLVISDDLIDFEASRPISVLPYAFSPPMPAVLVRFDPPMCSDLRAILLKNARKIYKGKVHDGGTIVQARGGRFETPAEIKMHKLIGGDLVTLNVGSEIIYARQLGIHYAVLNVISNPAEGIKPWGEEDLVRTYRVAAPACKQIVLQSVLDAADLQHKCTCNKYRDMPKRLEREFPRY